MSSFSKKQRVFEHNAVVFQITAGLAETECDRFLELWTIYFPLQSNGRFRGHRCDTNLPDRSEYKISLDDYIIIVFAFWAILRSE